MATQALAGHLRFKLLCSQGPQPGRGQVASPGWEGGGVTWYGQYFLQYIKSILLFLKTYFYIFSKLSLMHFTQLCIPPIDDFFPVHSLLRQLYQIIFKCLQHNLG